MAKNVTFYWKTTWTTCRKAKASLSQQGVKFTERELTKQPLTAAEIRRLSGGKPETLIDRRKPSFRGLGIGDRPLSDDEAIALMQREPSIIRRPIYEIDGKIVIGAEEKKVMELLR